MKRAINNHRQPLPLDCGIVLAAAGLDGSSCDAGRLSDRDRKRYVNKGLVAVVEDATPAAPALRAEADEAPEKRRIK